MMLLILHLLLGIALCSLVGAEENETPSAVSAAPGTIPPVVYTSPGDDVQSPVVSPTGVCSLCPTGQSVIFPELDLTPDFTGTCAVAASLIEKIYPLGSEECNETASFFSAICGCSPSPSPSVSAAPITTAPVHHMIAPNNVMFSPVTAAPGTTPPVDAFRCTLCADGEPVPNLKFVPFGDASTGNETCGLLETIASFILDPNQCVSRYQSFYGAICGCKSYVPPPNAVCTTVCADGNPVPNPNENAFEGVFDAAGNRYNTTCHQLEAITSTGTEIEQVCDAIHYLGANRCGCDDILPPPSCTLCQDGTFPSDPGFVLANNTVCVEWAALIWDEQDPEVCSSFQQFAGHYCGCNIDEDEAICRICGDNILPFPDFNPTTLKDQDCGLIELEANLDKTLCQSYQDAYQGDCCAASEPIMSPVMSPSAFTSSPTPNFQQPSFNPTSIPTVFTPFPTPVQQQPAFNPASIPTVFTPLPPPILQPVFNPTSIPTVFSPFPTPMLQPVFNPASIPTVFSPFPTPMLQPVFNPASIPTVSTPFPTPMLQPVFNPASAPALTSFPSPLGFPSAPSQFAPFFSPAISPVDATCETVCPDGLPVDKQDKIAFVDAGDVEVTCGQLDALIASSTSLLFLDCEIVAYLGTKVCGCENVLPEPFCEICEDGSAPPNPASALDDQVSCAAVAVQLGKDGNNEQCKEYQGTAGVYCACDNPIASEGICRICGDGVLLPNPSFVPIAGEGSCALQEFIANTQSDCAEIRKEYEPLCCNFTVPSAAPTPVPTKIMIASSESPGNSTNISAAPAPAPADTNMSANNATIPNNTDTSATPAPTPEDSASCEKMPNALIAITANLLLVLLSY